MCFHKLPIQQCRNDLLYIYLMFASCNYRILYFYAVYHWMEVNVRMRMLGLGKAQSVERLSEEMAIELGAEMLGEFVIFSMAAVTVVLEYKRSSKKEALKEEKQKHDFLMLQQKLQVSYIFLLFPLLVLFPNFFCKFSYTVFKLFMIASAAYEISFIITPAKLCREKF